MRRLIRVFAATAAIGLLIPSPGKAQYRSRTRLVLPPPQGLTVPDSAHAVQLNPSALAFVPSWAMSFQHVETLGARNVAGAGDALRAVAPLFFGIVGAVGIDSVRPAGEVDQGDAGVGSLALAYAGGPRWSVGLASRFFAARDPNLSGLVSLDLSTTVRLSPQLAFSAQLRDITGPVFGGPGDVPYPAVGLLSAALRPTGDRGLTIDMGAAVDSEGQVGLRGAVEVSVPGLGRVFVAAEALNLDAEAAWVASGGVAVDVGRFGVSGGAFLGPSGGGPGLWAGVHAEGFERRGISLGTVMLDVPVEGPLGARGLLALVRLLETAARDERVSGVFLRLRSSGIGTAASQELRAVIERLQESGKPVVCHLEAANEGEYVACGAATQTLIDPAGGVRLEGSVSTTLLLSEAMDRVGIRGQFVRIGPYKGAVERFTERRSSGPVASQRSRFLEAVQGQRLRLVASDRGFSFADVEAMVGNGPFLTPELIERGLVSGSADATELVGRLQRQGHDLADALPPRAPDRLRDPYLGVVVVDGEIVEGENVDVPFVGVRMSGSETVGAALQFFGADPWCRAIVLRVDSPGGSALASDQIWRAVRRAAARKPVVASLGTVAASGGFYVASAADHVFANPATLTGSIGIFAGKFDVAQLAERIGVNVETVQGAPHAGIDSPYRPFSDAERALAAEKIRIWYRLFLRRVAEGRNMTAGEVHAVGEGRLWTGAEAETRGLVDQLGGFVAALEWAQRQGGLDVDAPLRILPRRPRGLRDYLLREVFGDAAASFGDSGGLSGAVQETHPGGVLPHELRQMASFFWSMSRSSLARPMARLESPSGLP